MTYGRIRRLVLRGKDELQVSIKDGLGSVRGVADTSAAVLEARQYDSYGSISAMTGMSQTMYGFTGEPTDGNGLVHLRARHYSPGLGAFTTLDPYEGMAQRPMSLNGYSWVEGNSVNWTDPSGKFPFLLALGIGALSGIAANIFEQVGTLRDNCVYDAGSILRQMDVAQLLLNGALGATAAGLLAVSSPMAISGLLAGGGYYLGRAMYNQFVGRDLRDGMTFREAATNVIAGAVLGRLNLAVLNNTLTLPTAWQLSARAGGYVIAGFTVNNVLHTLTDDDPYATNQETLVVALGSLNIVSLFINPWIAAGLTLFANSVITGTGLAGDM